MRNVDNVKLFEFSLNNPESIIDQFYLKNGNLGIYKVSTILEKLGYKKSNDETLKNFVSKKIINISRRIKKAKSFLKPY